MSLMQSQPQVKKGISRPGENLITQGEKGDTAFFILTGKASCTRREKGQVLKDDLLPGTLAGELAMLVETVHGVTVTASGRLRALALPRQAIRGVMESRPRIAKNIAERCWSACTASLPSCERSMASSPKSKRRLKSWRFGESEIMMAPSGSNGANYRINAPC